MRLLLFDIDGTLVTTKGAGKRALDVAFAELFGWDEATRDIRFGGMTDPLIVREVFARRGLDAAAADAARPAILERYVVALAHELERRREDAVSLPGVRTLLDALRPRTDDCVLAVLTGNVERGARLKLRAVDLEGYFDLGAYGDEGPTRPDLLPVALERAARLTGKRLDPRASVVIGDTPADVAVARAHGARAVAVATGASTKDELRAHTPDVLLDSLAHLPAAVDALLA